MNSMPALSSTLHMIDDGPAGIAQTLAYMGKCVKAYKMSLQVRGLAVQLTNALNPKDWSGEIRVLHAYVRDNIRYINDIDGVETIQTPDVTLQIGAGDCDDKSTLLAALLGSIGHPTRFIAIGFAPNVYSHVYVEARIGNDWIPLETTEDVDVGWQPDPRTVRARKYFYN